MMRMAKKIPGMFVAVSKWVTVKEGIRRHALQLLERPESRLGGK